MLFIGLTGIIFGILIASFLGDYPGTAFLAGVNFGWGLLLVLIALIVRRAEYKREQWWKKDD